VTNGMGKTYALIVIAVALGTGIGISAAQRGVVPGVAQAPDTPGLKPTPELREVMRANATVLAVDGRGGNITGKIGEHLRTDDYDGLVADAVALKPNFEKILATFTELKMADAIGYAKAGSKALVDLETAAKAKDKHGIAQAQIDLANACRNCHIARRVMVLRVPMQFEISQN
jgi:hypothetical protein